MKNIGILAGSIMFTLFIICFLWWEWQHYGVAKEDNTLAWDMTETDSQYPEIYSVNKRVTQGEKVSVSDLAQAKDTDGSDLSGSLMCYDQDGDEILGDLDTSTPGVYHITWKVRSAITGRSVQKQMIILVDGRVS